MCNGSHGGQLGSESHWHSPSFGLPCGVVRCSHLPFSWRRLDLGFGFFPCSGMLILALSWQPLWVSLALLRLAPRPSGGGLVLIGSVLAFRTACQLRALSRFASRVPTPWTWQRRLSQPCQRVRRWRFSWSGLVQHPRPTIPPPRSCALMLEGTTSLASASATIHASPRRSRSLGLRWRIGECLTREGVRLRQKG